MSENGKSSSATCAPITRAERADGTEANGPSSASDLAGDGALVAFESEATSLVTGDTNGQVDIFVANLQLQEQLATPTPAPVIGTGTGLRGDYFNNTSLSGSPTVIRLDSQVAFAWGEGTPAPGVNADNFSVRWTGEVQAAYSQAYTFRTLSDDGVRLWLDGDLVTPAPAASARCRRLERARAGVARQHVQPASSTQRPRRCSLVQEQGTCSEWT